MSTVSIIIPVYNTEKYLRRCLESVIAQTFSDWEAILVNDGSTDGCGNICDEYAKRDNRFKVIHQENAGVVNARNKAIKTCNGTFLSFIDSDDYIEPTMLKDMTTLAQTESLDFICGKFNIILKDRSFESDLLYPLNSDTAFRQMLSGKLPGWLPGKIIRKTFWDKCNIQTDETAVILEDTFITIQLLFQSPVIGVIKKAFYNYDRSNDTAASSDNSNRIIIRGEKNILHIYNFLNKKNIFEVYKQDFTGLALQLKFEYLRYDIDKAVETYPFAHKKLKNFKLSFFVSLFYWIAFNCGNIGKFILKKHIERH